MGWMTGLQSTRQLFGNCCPSHIPNGSLRWPADVVPKLEASFKSSPFFSASFPLHFLFFYLFYSAIDSVTHFLRNLTGWRHFTVEQEKLRNEVTLMSTTTNDTNTSKRSRKAVSQPNRNQFPLVSSLGRRKVKTNTTTTTNNKKKGHLHFSFFPSFPLSQSSQWPK